MVSDFPQVGVTHSFIQTGNTAQADGLGSQVKVQRFVGAK